MKKKYFLSLLILTLSTSCQNKNINSSHITTSSSSYEIVNPLLEIHSLEMKQMYGDCTLIKLNNFEILVDGGERGDDLLVKKALDKYVIDGRLDMIIVTHPHSDHVGGIINRSTFSSIKSIGMIIDTGYNYGVRQSFKNNIIDYFVPLGTKYYTISEVMQNEDLVKIKIGDNCYLNFLNSLFYDKADTAAINNTSIGFYIEYYNTFLVMMGDAEEEAENGFKMLNNKFTRRENQVIFKANHHGSAGANKSKILDFIEPDYCFASAAFTINNNGAPSLEQHPYYAAVLRMAAHTKKVYWNGINGNLNMYTDGYSPLQIEGEGRTLNYSYYNKETGLTYPVDPNSEKNVTYFESKWYQVGVENAGWIDLK